MPDPERIAALAKLLNEAKAPMLWVGGGALHASAEIRALAERINAPVVSFRSGRGIIDDRHPLGLTVAVRLQAVAEDRSAGRVRHPAGGADVALGRVARRPEARPHRHRPRRDAPPARPTSPIVADSADAARALTAVVEPRNDPARAEAIAQAKADAAQAIQKVQPQMSFLNVDPRRAARERHLLRRDDPGRLRLLVRLADLRARAR